MNQGGQVIVHLASSDFINHTFLVGSRGTRTDIGSLFGFTTIGYALNDAGQIAGISYNEPQGLSYAFLWTPHKGMVQLSEIPGPYPCSVNNRGDVVGGLGRLGGPDHGFIYTEGQAYDLNNVPIIGGDAWDFLGPALFINNTGEILGNGRSAGSSSSTLYILTPTTLGSNLLGQPGFEGYAPPDLGLPGWVSDSSRQVMAKSEWNQPHTGDKNGACWTTENLDCGMYQEVVAPATGTYSLTLYANADRAGGYVGANVNGGTMTLMTVDVRGYRSYGAAYTMTFTASQGDRIHVWMYSPATPGYVVIDDVSLTVQ
jgi:hypothetical protein